MILCELGKKKVDKNNGSPNALGGVVHMSETGKRFKFMLLEGDAKEKLKDIPDNVIHCGVTSPPYWQQRDYKEKEQLGQEKTPEEYVDKLVLIMKEVKRVLRKDGTFWLNMGDSYCKKDIKSSNLKQKDLIGVPWMTALALRKDGWYLRSDIIWYKKNPQPESIIDRPSKSHEYIFLFSKSSIYFYDAEIIKEKQKEISLRRAFSVNRVKDRKDYNNPNYAISGEAQEKTYEKLREEVKDGKVIKCNKRDVWEVSAAHQRTPHFAVFSRDLILPCIQAGSSTGGCCSKCNMPWKRINNKDNPKLDWTANCNCGIKESNRCLVLDPFNGAGTTGEVCAELERNYLGIELNSIYVNYTRKIIGRFDSAFEPEVVIFKELMT